MKLSSGYCLLATYAMLPFSFLGGQAMVLAQNNGNGNGNGGGNGNKKEVVLMTRGGTTDASADAGFSSVGGEMEDIAVGADLAQLPIIKLQGLKQNPNQPVVFQKKSSSVEQAPTDLALGTATTATTTFWYGEEVGRGDRTISLVAGADGSILGSCTDGAMSYMIQSVESGTGGTSNGAKRLKYWAAEIKDLPPFNVTSGGGDRRQLITEGSLRGSKGVDIKEVSAAEEDQQTRDLQSVVYIRFAVFYTSLSYSTLGATGASNYAALCVSQMNQILSNSGITSFRFQNLGYLIEQNFPDYWGQASGAYLNALKTPGDGYFDGIFSSQTTHNIDVVAVVGEYVYTGEASNVGPTMYGLPQKKGYVETNRYRGTLAGDYLMAHELGHVIGGCHDNDPTCQPANHGAIYSSSCTRSVMAYPNCPSTCGGYCPVVARYSSGQSIDYGRNNAYYMKFYGPPIASLY